MILMEEVRHLILNPKISTKNIFYMLLYVLCSLSIFSSIFPDPDFPLGFCVLCAVLLSVFLDPNYLRIFHFPLVTPLLV